MLVLTNKDYLGFEKGISCFLCNNILLLLTNKDDTGFENYISENISMLIILQVHVLKQTSPLTLILSLKLLTK